MTTHARPLRTPLGAALLTLCLLIGLAGCDSDPSPSAKNTGKTGKPWKTGKPAPKTGAPQASASQADVTRRLLQLEKARDVRVGAYAIDTGTGQVLAHRADERFPFASSFKVMACAAVLRKARRTDPGLMDRVIRYGRNDLSAFSPETEKHVGTGMTVAELCRATITRSDNTAANLLLKQIGGPQGLTAFFRSLGDTVSRSDRVEPGLNRWRPGELRDTTTPAPWARNLQALTVGDALVPADRARLVAWMKATVTGGERIRAGLPGGWTVGDKTGTAGVHGNANDIAVVWPPSGAPLILAVLITRPDADAEADDKAVAATAGILAHGLRPS
ncbi:beta-lactamase class A [Actinomadura pelletieri DSM 43383]|uniref:Beta-lactamase class A n=1 Tax=Actinomadura pelletieri DSM 43383 TaxID=1120940 RepID=A0A495QJ11_9ACTN|nr:class A beta-lactamase [Actinomadura pelletieri]RKS72111.1 beta-lactamase class A [Actinomadura pelletieri DSM 43383]